MTLFVERRRPSLTPELLVRVGLAFAMIAALLIVTNLPAILAYRFPDPDDTLRLVQVRDLIAGQGWFDLTQHRIDAPGGGVAMHWSRLVDLPIAGVILALRGLVGQAAAETAALIAVPLLTFAVALLLAGRIAWRLIGDEATGFACLAMALSVPLIQQLRPMRIDHHGWQVVCVLAAVNGLMARSPRLGGWVTGLALAVGVSISIEGLPLAAAICGVAALRWLRDRHESDWLTATLQGLAGGSLALYAVTRGLGATAQHCDAISPAHLAAFGVAALAATGLARFEPLPRCAQVGGLGVVGGLAILTFLDFAPLCAGGAFAAIDPKVAQYWFQGVSEGLPVWRQEPAFALQTVIPPLVGLLAALRLAGRSGDWLRCWWQDYAMILAAALLIAVFVARAGAVAGALAAVPLGLANPRMAALCARAAPAWPPGARARRNGACTRPGDAAHGVCAGDARARRRRREWRAPAGVELPDRAGRRDAAHAAARRNPRPARYRPATAVRNPAQRRRHGPPPGPDRDAHGDRHLHRHSGSRPRHTRGTWDPLPGAVPRSGRARALRRSGAWRARRPAPRRQGAGMARAGGDRGRRQPRSVAGAPLIAALGGQGGPPRHPAIAPARTAAYGEIQRTLERGDIGV